MSFSSSSRRLCFVSFLMVALVSSGGRTYVRCDEGNRSLADRLLALWTNSRSGTDGASASAPSLPAIDESKLSSELARIDSNGIGADLNSDESLKKVLDFLGAKAAISTGSRKLPVSALAGLKALASGTAKKPNPIDLRAGPDAPVRAVLDYFHELGIDDFECRKRTICELLTEPQAGYGVFGELLGYVFGNDVISHEWTTVMDADTYEAYHEAAVAGRRMLECDQLYGVCRNSYREYIKLINVR